MAKNNILIRSRIKKARLTLESGDIEKAKLEYQNLYSKNKRNVEIALTLANIYRRLNQTDEALTICEIILSNNKDNPHALYVKGAVFFTQNRIDESIELYKKSINIDSSIFDAHYFLGVAYLTVNNIDLAAISFKNSINIDQNNIASLTNLGAIRIAQRKFNDAVTILLKVIKLDPKCLQAMCNLSDLYIDLNDLDLAKKYANRALSIDEHFFDTHKVLGKLYLQTGEYELAVKHFHIAHDIKPDDFNIIGALAQTLELMQEYEKGRSLLAPIIESDAPNCSVLIAYSSLSRHFGNESMAINLIEHSLASKVLVERDQILLQTELGKQYDKKGKYDLAFLAYSNANKIELQLNSNTVLPSSLVRITADDVCDWGGEYTKSFWQDIPDSGDVTHAPIFIVGMPRSGTTLIEQILSSHTAVEGGGELNFIGNVANKYNRLFHSHSPGYLKDIPENQLKSESESYINLLMSINNNSKEVTNKMPTDFWHIGLIYKLFPNAKIIHVTRDPIDTCLSIYFQRFGATFPFTTDLDAISEYYLSYIEIMKYWNSIFPNIKNINYEHLVHDQEMITRDLLDYCNLEWDMRCLDFHTNKRLVNTPSYDQVRKPLYTSSISRWHNYRSHIRVLSDAFEKK